MPIVLWTRDVPSEQERAVGRALAAQAAGEVAGEPLAVGRLCPRCASREHGRPYVAGRPELGLSVAHSGGFVVAAATVGPVGVDIEPLAHADRMTDIASVIRHPREPVAEGEAALARWVAKEAVLKATGDGLTREMSTLRLPDPAWMVHEVPIDGALARMAVPASAPGMLVIRHVAWKA